MSFLNHKSYLHEKKVKEMWEWTGNLSGLQRTEEEGGSAA